MTDGRKAGVMSDWLVGGGQTGDLIRSMDWSVTAPGVRSAWPQSLRTAVGMVLSSHFPMAILWGADLVLLYNDACAALLAGRHPQAMGQPADKVWPELSGFNSPLGLPRPPDQADHAAAT